MKLWWWYKCVEKEVSLADALQSREAASGWADATTIL